MPKIRPFFLNDKGLSCKDVELAAPLLCIARIVPLNKLETALPHVLSSTVQYIWETY